MKGFAVSLIIAAFAIAGGSSLCTNNWPDIVDETPYPSRYVMTVKNSAGADIGELEYCNRGNYAAFVSGSLKGLPAGKYVGLVHEYGNFNGSCNSAGLLTTHLKFAFGPTTVNAPDMLVNSYTQGLYLGCDNQNYPNGHLALIYSVPSDKPAFFEAKETRTHQAPVACGLIKLRAPCTN